MRSRCSPIRLASTGQRGGCGLSTASLWATVAVLLCLLPLLAEGRAGSTLARQYAQAARIARCADDDALFQHCFLCGKVADDGRIYRGCCEGDETVTLFCDHMML